MPRLDLLPEDELQLGGVVRFYEGDDGRVEGAEDFGGELGRRAGLVEGGIWRVGWEEVVGCRWADVRGRHSRDLGLRVAPVS